ncbi:MAG: class I SAM-dependent methyltransferase [Solirubrobacteraceae bacterium]|nr:class I SAM-dependent methyltransferase [Patulibacter sp.]
MGSGPDWGNGYYENFAPELVPAAERLVELAAPQKGERAIDLGCGTGNATVPLAASGAQVTAVDPSLRLLAIAAERVREEGLRITTSLGGAEQLPLPDRDADLVISNFGVIFATDAEAALRESLRVLAAGGRFLYSAWLPEGPISAVRDVMVAAAGSRVPDDVPGPLTDAPRPILWHDPSSFEHLIPGGTDAITVHHGAATFTADSPRAWMEQQAGGHPVWLMVRDAIDDDAIWDGVIERGTEVLTAASTDGDRFSVDSPYVIVEIHPTR